MKDEILNLSEDNPYNGMTKSDFVGMLQILGVQIYDGDGRVIIQDKDLKKSTKIILTELFFSKQ